MPSRTTPTEATERLGKNIERIRLDLGWGTNEAARNVGISSSTMIQLEAGRRTPSFAVLLSIRSHMHTSWVELLQGVE